jgi:hypothetical protein
MGWASWNSFASSIDSTVIKQQADALVSSGMAAAGYKYVNLDDGWWQGDRDANDNIVVDENLFPGGMKAMADYIHSKGLKAGIYTDAGKQGCGCYYPTTRPAAPDTGMEGHYQQDLQTFQSWGFDYVKIDWCGGRVEGLDQETQYKQISAANEAASCCSSASGAADCPGTRRRVTATCGAPAATSSCGARRPRRPRCSPTSTRACNRPPSTPATTTTPTC